MKVHILEFSTIVSFIIIIEPKVTAPHSFQMTFQARFQALFSPCSGNEAHSRKPWFSWLWILQPGNLPNTWGICFLVVMDLHPVFVEGFSGLSYPESPDIYADGPYRIWRNISNRVDIPSNFFTNAIGKGKNGGKLLWYTIYFMWFCVVAEDGNVWRS